MPQSFQVVVIGAGHAGTEAALASARMGLNTAIITQKRSDIGQMSCNPSIGGIGKSHLVREVDAMGGAMALAAESAAIQLRVLNSRKGPAVRATRAQADRKLYSAAMQDIVAKQPNLQVVVAEVVDLVEKGGRIEGVLIRGGDKISARAVVLATGTFLGGKLFIGDEVQIGGRFGDNASIKLAQRLRELPLKIGRLKTGTPARVAANSLDYSKMVEQWGDTPEPLLSFWGTRAQHPRQLCCYLTKTTEKTHDIIRQHLDKSPLFSGAIEGVGPRYCPSIEDKVIRFADRNSHQVFVEPEGLDSPLIYPNGISTSLPKPAQLEFVRTVVGFENAEIIRWGYAIEYDYLQPQGLQLSLESKYLQGLYLAGQINGTTGYEEAAAQGLIAGVNAAQSVVGQMPLILGRHQAYTGVMIDDLITLGTSEPYRMFTSRAEYRLNLRQDNADARLTAIARKLGLISDRQWQMFEQKQSLVQAEKQRLQKAIVQPHSREAKVLDELCNLQIQREYSQLDLLKRPEVSHSALLRASAMTMLEKVSETVEIDIKYQGYLVRQQQEINHLKSRENTKIPLEFNYCDLPGLSNEIVDKLTRVRPQTLGQASRIPGITPVAISLLSVYLKKAS